MAFTGRATDSPGIFAGTPEDVSELITMTSPTETPILDLFGDSDLPATRVLHEWLEDALSPNAVTVSTVTAVASLAGGAADSWSINGGLAAFIQDGTVLYDPVSGEYVRVTQVIAPNTLVVSRGFGGSATGTGGTNNADLWVVVSTAQPEGRAVAKDVSRPRARNFNFTQIFMKDIIISGTEEAMLHIGVPDEWNYQVEMRTKENLIDLERAIILGIWSGNSIGGASNVRTLAGIFAMIKTNVGSYAWGTGTTFEADVNSTLSRAFLQGGTDVDVVLTGVTLKSKFDLLNATRIRTLTAEENRIFTNRITVYENTYGTYRLLMDRWVPPTKMAAVATSRCKVAPAVNRSFHAKQTAVVGDSINGFCLGEYTFIMRNEAAMAQATFGDLGYSQLNPAK